MNKINWKLAPEGAIGVAQRGQQLAFVDNDRNIFLDGHWGISMGWELVAKRPTFAESITKTPQLEQTKTVADAVVAYPKWQEPHFMPTRENLEKIAKDAQGDFVEVREKEGEKWTHTYDGQKVRWLGDKPDSCEEMAIQYQSGEYGLARVSALKPIKPTISEDSKRQLELYVQYRVDKYGDYAMKSDLSDYLSYHDIVGVSAND